MAVTVKDLTGVKLTSVSLSTDLANRLKQDILSGVLKDKQKITEKNICDQYGVSRTPVREALAKLETEGLIESVPNRGAFVRSLTKQDWIDELTLRKLYEVQAATWAAERITDEELEELEETFEFMEFYTMKGDVEKMLGINRNFHQVLYRASKNRMLTSMLPSYQGYFKHFTGVDEDEQEYLAAVLEEHRAIFEAVRKRDGKAAAKAMGNHMDMFAKRQLPKFK